MRGEGGVHTVKYPRLQQAYLAAATLLRWRTDNNHLAGQVFGVSLQAQGSAHGSHGDEVMPAAVPNLWKGVVLRQHGDSGTLAAATGDGGPKGRFHAADAPFHRKAVLLQEASQGFGGIVFLVVQFRMGVNVQRQVEELLPGGLDNRI